jgi:hypothetical protein
LQAAQALQFDVVWTFDTIAYLQLRGGAYVTLARWNLEAQFDRDNDADPGP